MSWRFLLAPAGVVALAVPAGAWPADVMHGLSRDARRLLPRTLAQLLAERESQIHEGLERFPAELARSLAADLAAGRLSPPTLAALDSEAARVVELLREGHVGEGLVRLGVLLRVPADPSDPVLGAGPRGYPPGVVREYYAFVDQSLEKMPVVLDDAAALELTRPQLPAYWQGLLERSRGESGVIRGELYRDGRAVDHRTLDFRSPVFGVASLAYSRAVTSIAATWLALWREARGDTTRMPAPRRVRPSERPSPVHP